tara:strand:- start:219 stop:1160 length:942 start_codon:yes stop_codon:yes gene_type:complete
MAEARATQQKSVPARVGTLIGIVSEKNPRHSAFVEHALTLITDAEIADLERYLGYCEDKGHNLEYLAQCYLTIVQDTLKEQMYFMRNRKYQQSNYEEVAKAIYHNKEYMDRYMYGLAITGFFWPNHVEMGRFFMRTLPKDKGGKYLEIGPGHGYYFMKALELGSFDSLLGIDISEASVRQSQAILDHFYPDEKDRYELRQMNFLDADGLEAESYDTIVMGEVLEHVENPLTFMKRIAELAKPDAYIYMTTCANAPAIDHIYLYECPKDVEDQFEEAGLDIVEACILPYEGQTIERCIKDGLAINVAYTLKKKA